MAKLHVSCQYRCKCMQITALSAVVYECCNSVLRAHFTWIVAPVLQRTANNAPIPHVCSCVRRCFVSLTNNIQHIIHSCLSLFLSGTHTMSISSSESDDSIVHVSAPPGPPPTTIVVVLPPKPTPSWDKEPDIFNQITWSDIVEDAGGTPYTVLGYCLADLSCKHLKKVCSRLDVKGIKNVKKADMIDRINKTHRNRKAYKTQEDFDITNKENLGAPRKEVQCVYRLMNLLFSDGFATDFGNIGKTASKALLDTGTAGNDQHFWIKVQKAFVDDTNIEFGEFDFQSDEVFAGLDHIDPSRIVKHDWKKLRDIWKGVNADYRAAHGRFNLSGTHDSNFFSFCYGKVDIYYLRKKLDLKPGLNEFVQAGLPAGCALSSDMSIGDTPVNAKRTGAKDSTNSSRKAAKSKIAAESAHVLAAAFRGVGESFERSIKTTSVDNAKAKYYGDKVDALDRKIKYETWERMGDRILLLNTQMKTNQSLDTNEKHDMWNETRKLKKARVKLESFLGMLDDEDDDDNSSAN